MKETDPTWMACMVKELVDVDGRLRATGNASRSISALCCHVEIHVVETRRDDISLRIRLRSLLRDFLPLPFPLLLATIHCQVLVLPFFTGSLVRGLLFLLALLFLLFALGIIRL